VLWRPDLHGSWCFCGCLMREDRLVTPRRFRREFQNTEVRPRPPLTQALAQDRSSQSELRDLSGKPRAQRMCATAHVCTEHYGTTIKVHYGNITWEEVCVASRGSSAHSVRCVYRAHTRPQTEGYSVFLIHFIVENLLKSLQLQNQTDRFIML